MEANRQPLEAEPFQGHAAIPSTEFENTAVLTWQRAARPARLYRRAGKRALDLGLGAVLLIALLPLMAIVALCVLATGGAPVLYASERAGRHGRSIRVWKFRTMVRNADGELKRWLAAQPALAAEYAATRKLRDDPRVTRVGRFLRKSSLDELPQVWNVLRGEMSLVGPRPVPHAELAEQYGVYSEQAFAVRPGMTGLWQVNGRSATSYAARVRYDCEYAATANLLLDLKILALTVPAVALSRGAE